MNDLFNKLEKYYLYTESINLIFGVIIMIFGMVCGGMIGQLINDYSTNHFNLTLVIITFICICVYLYLEIKQKNKDKKFPITILDHLKAVEELKKLKEIYNKKSILYGFINNSIITLNSNTCPLPNYNDNLCDQKLKDGLQNVLNDLVEHPQTILN